MIKHLIAVSVSGCLLLGCAGIDKVNGVKLPTNRPDIEYPPTQETTDNQNQDTDTQSVVQGQQNCEAGANCEQQVVIHQGSNAERDLEILRTWEHEQWEKRLEERNKRVAAERSKQKRDRTIAWSLVGVTIGALFLVCGVDSDQCRNSGD